MLYLHQQVTAPKATHTKTPGGPGSVNLGERSRLAGGAIGGAAGEGERIETPR
jgi:hypothetical protein